MSAQMEEARREFAAVEASLARDRLARAAIDERDAAAVARAEENLRQARKAVSIAVDRLEHAQAQEKMNPATAATGRGSEDFGDPTGSRQGGITHVAQDE